MDYLSGIYPGELVEEINPLLGSNEEFKESREIIESYLKKFRSYLNEYSRHLKRTFRVIVTDYLPPHILGMTDCKGTIWIRRLYGYLKDHVLKHEIIHNLFPYLEELSVERLNRAGYIQSLSNFNLIYLS